MTFKEWLIRREYPEMVGTGAIYDGTKSPDFNWQGAPESAIKPKKKHKKKHEGFDNSFSRAQLAYDNQTPYDDETECQECKGEGHTACEYGGKDRNCPECKGTGTVECRECEGSGVMTHAQAKKYHSDRRDWDDQY